jgi:hypothetical protein
MAQNRGRPNLYLCSRRRTSSPQPTPRVHVNPLGVSTSATAVFPATLLASLAPRMVPVWPPFLSPPRAWSAPQTCSSGLHIGAVSQHPVALLRHDSTSNTKNASVRPMCCRPDSLSIAPRRAVVVVLRDTSRWLWFELCLQFVLHHVFTIRLAPSGPTPESLVNVGGLVVQRVARFH